MRRSLLGLAVVLLAALAAAAVTTCELPTPGVVWGSTAMRARGAVEKVEHVQEVKSDVHEHTITVTFDAEKVQMAAIIQALNAAGYTVGEPKELTP